MIDVLTPEIFDILIIGNLVVAVLLAGRRFFNDIRGPLPDDAPKWARASYQPSQTSSSSQDS